MCRVGEITFRVLSGSGAGIFAPWVWHFYWSNLCCRFFEVSSRQDARGHGDLVFEGRLEKVGRSIDCFIWLCSHSGNIGVSIEHFLVFYISVPGRGTEKVDYSRGERSPGVLCLLCDFPIMVEGSTPERVLGVLKMDFFTNLDLAFRVILQPENLFSCFLGVLMGTLVGVLPGLGPVAAISILLPSTYHMTPVSATIMLGGIYYGAMYGGSTTSILVNIPGESASVVTCLDGYQMSRQGRAGPALGISAFASFIAGTIATIIIMVAAPPLANFAIGFGPPEYFSLMFLGLTMLVYLAMGSMLNALLMAAVGIFLGTIGTDPIHATERFTYGSYTLLDGLGLVPVLMGLFGISEVLLNIEQSLKVDIYKTAISKLLPTLEDWKKSIGPILRGTFIGYFIGILPGGTAVVSSFAAYIVEKKISKYPEKFGTGVIEGVAAPEAANNAASQGSFIPLLTLGIPSNIVMAVLLGAFLIHGVTPGPLLIKKYPDLFWGVIGSMYIGNFMLLILNLPLIGMWVKLLRVPYSILFPTVLFFCVMGAYSVNNNYFEVIIMNIFGIVGYLMKKFKYEGAPLILAFVLCPMMENALRQSLLMSHGSFLIFLTRPISLILSAVAILLLCSPFIPGLKRRPKGGDID
jgi:putative tricarboxylic transport membrane protein